eukprot:CAMPEP_0169103468 /NCGR_PEP_ID=MMETSP1015-20121227/22732_1 /TAXON_ID=342587 /ORGANISM="Karlodinium micrum, Strain CCMP2283" /LENGTH=449 /DNA_ID=CAMNT_0009164669 /DNA_START=21 /DNA_END=1369 /DNA_ORIENTATION=-
MSHGHEAHGEKHGHGHGHGHGEGGGCCGGHDNDLEQPLLKEEHGHEHGGGHDHGHSHGGGGGCHGHGHGGEPDSEDIGKLKKAVYMALFFMFVELVGGYIANSLAIMTDAAHMLSDVGGFIISLFGLYLAQRAASQEFTYGFKQAEVLGAFLSILIVWALTAVLLYEAVLRFQNPEAIDAPMMFTISVIGFLVNLVLMKVLGHSHGHGGHDHAHGGDEHDENIAVKAAIAHVIGDIVQSLGVCLASGLIWWQPFDIGYTADGGEQMELRRPVVHGSIRHHGADHNKGYNNICHQHAKNINQDQMVDRLLKIQGVHEIHDMHVWSMGSAEVLCTAHVMIKHGKDQTRILKECIELAKSLGIGHSTFQLEIFGEFDPGIETFGNLKCNTIRSLPGKDASDAGHGDCCDGHGHSDGGHGGHGGHGSHGDGHSHGDSGHGHGGHGEKGGHSHD